MDCPDGLQVYFTKNATTGSWVADSDVDDKLVQFTDSFGVTVSWRYTSGNDDVENYDATGKLLSISNHAGLKQTLSYDGNGRIATVTDAFNRQLGFTYDASKRIATMTDSAGGVFIYGYGTNNNLSSVAYPDNTPGISTDNPKRIYLYNEAANTSGANLPNALTGLTDENGVRFATWQYDASGRAIASEHAGGVEKVTLAYNFPAAGQTTVSDYKDSAATANVSRTYNFQTIFGVVKNTSVSQPCSSGCGGANAATTYDLNGNVASRTDFNSNKTAYDYDLTRNLETQRIEGLTSAGATTPQTRTITTEWHPNWRLPKRMAEPKRITSYAYNGDGGFYCAPTTALVNGVPIGVLCSKAITETTDANGGLGVSATAVTPANVRTWAYTYEEALRSMLAQGSEQCFVSTRAHPLRQVAPRS